MTKDMILVEREYDGERCREGCRFDLGWGRCEWTNETIDDRGDSVRCPTCLATPSAVVLTPEMVEAVKLAMGIGDQCSRGYLAKVHNAIRAAFPTISPPGGNMNIIEELRELEAKATPAPWELQYDNTGRGQWWSAGPAEFFFRWNDPTAEKLAVADSALTSAMRNALPALLARLEALEDVAEAAGFALDDDGAKWVGILRERLDALEALP